VYLFYGFIRCILATVCLDVSIMADTKNIKASLMRGLLISTKVFWYISNNAGE
jgi:hypothetical protein